MTAHQAPPSLIFSRQEHWSGLPFPSPMHENEKWKWSRSAVSDPQQPHGLQPTRLLRPRDFPGKSTRVGCHCLLQFIAYLNLIFKCCLVFFLACQRPWEWALSKEGQGMWDSHLKNVPGWEVAIWWAYWGSEAAGVSGPWGGEGVVREGRR